MLHSLFLPENVMHSEDINKTFLSAIQDGHLEDVQLCLHNHADIEARNELGYTCLHFLAREGNLKLITFLVEKRANVNAIDNHNCTPLHWAASCGHLSVIKYLLGNFADIKATDEDGHSLLHWASNKGHLEVVEFLLSTLQINVNDTDKNGRTPLHYCAKKGHVKVLICLLENGANTELTDDMHRTASDYSRTAEIRGHFKAKDALNLANYIEYIDCKDYRFHCHMRHTAGNDDTFIKAHNVRNSLLLYSLQNASIEYASAADLKSRLIFLHLAIEDRYATLEREGDIAGFEICMQYQDNIYLLVCPDDPEPNANIRRPLLTALTLAHYVQYEEYSAQCGIDCFHLKEPGTHEEKWQINDEKSSNCRTDFLFKSAEKIKESLTILHQQLTSRYQILQKDKDIIGCTIILQYQDKITNLLATSSK